MKLKQRLPLRQGHDHSPRSFGIIRQTCVGRFAAGRAVRCAQWAVQFGRHRHASPNAMASPTAIFDWAHGNGQTRAAGESSARRGRARARELRGGRKSRGAIVIVIVLVVGSR